MAMAGGDGDGRLSFEYLHSILWLHDTSLHSRHLHDPARFYQPYRPYEESILVPTIENASHSGAHVILNTVIQSTTPVAGGHLDAQPSLGFKWPKLNIEACLLSSASISRGFTLPS